MADPTKMSDEELRAAAAELSKRTAAETDAANAAFLEKIKPLVDAGFGGTKKVTIAEVIAALEATRATVPNDWFSGINAALTGLGLVQDKVSTALTPTVPVPQMPTPAAP